MQRRSHEGPVLKLSRHGIHGCAVDSRLNSQIRLPWFPIKTGANRESPRFPSGPAFDRRFFFRKSPRIGRGDRRGTRETARSIERFSRELRQPGIALCQGYRSSKAEERTRYTHESFSTAHGSLAIFWKETRDPVEYAEASVYAWLVASIWEGPWGLAAWRQATTRMSGRQRHVTEALSSSVGSAKWKN